MYGNILDIFTIVGMVSLYLVIVAIVIRGLFSATKNMDDEESGTIISILGGVFWPIAIPIGIFVYWIYSIIVSPFKAEESNSATKELDICKKELNKTKNKVIGLVEIKSEKVKQKFKVGDVITGVKGNPDGYNVLYEGCVCRVLKVDGNNPMRVILIDHKDKEAHQNKIGKTFTAPIRNFTLVKKSTKRTKK